MTPAITPQRRAFTLLEMLVALGLVFLLASLIIVALGGVRAAANRADTISSLRQMMQAYNNYLADNNQRLMPGNIDAAMVQQLGLEPRLPSGQPLVPGDAGSYVWRLSPYLDNNWETLFTDYRSSELIARLHLEFGGNFRSPCGPPGQPPCRDQPAPGLPPQSVPDRQPHQSSRPPRPHRRSALCRPPQT